MRKMYPVSRFVWAGLILMASAGTGVGPAFGQTTDHAIDRPAAAAAAPLSPEERTALIDALVDKWGAFVQVAYNLDVETWRSRLQAWAATIDATNLRRALERDSYEAAMATLVGRGARIADAPAARDVDVNTPQAVSNRLGDLAADITYTPITPCRIVDTRSAGGAIAAGATRSFTAVDINTYALQGGSATNCGLLGVSATAVTINVTAVTPTGPGYATVYPFGTAQPFAASLNFAAGAIVNNTVITRIPNPLLSLDFTIYSSAQSHYVVDIVGYFAPPQATELDCLETAQTAQTINPGVLVSTIAPSCPTGYFAVSTSCGSNSASMPLLFSRNGVCNGYNSGGASAIMYASRICCRVPGR